MAIVAEMRDGIGHIVLDRPEKAHAYDRAHLGALAEAYEDLSARAAVIVVRSTGDRAFCAGADLDELRAAPPEAALDLLSQRVFGAIARGPATTVAVVQGPAVAGGFELALACDFRVVGPRARFRLPETGLGIIPSAGGTTRLARVVGPARARLVVLAGHELDAREAVDWGLALGPHDDPLAAGLALARELAARDPLALRLARQVLDHAEDARSFEAERLAEALLYARRDRSR